MTNVTVCLWYDGTALEAAKLYTSLIDGSEITHVQDLPPDPSGNDVHVVAFTLAGQQFSGLDGGPGHPHTDAASIMVNLPDQAAVDRVWDGLLADGGTPVQCGWLTDRFGVSWQVIPAGFFELLQSDDQQAVGRAYAAMMGMQKLDLAALEAAFRGE